MMQLLDRLSLPLKSAWKNHNSRRTLVSVGVMLLVAFGLRLIYLLAALDHIGLDRFWAFTPDSRIYWAVASDMLGDQVRGPYCLFRVGPGYGLILALLRVAFGDGRLAGLLFSVVMGGLAPLVVYLFAVELFKKRMIGLVAGYLCAVSVTSISLSCHILTDQTFFTLFALGCWLFVKGLKVRSFKWFIGAGLVYGFAALVRPSGAIWPVFLLVIPFLIPVARPFGSRIDLIKHALIAGVLALLIVQSWSFRNYLVTGVFAFGSNGIITMRNCVGAQVATNNNSGLITPQRLQWEEDDNEFDPDLGAAYRRIDRRVWASIEAQPGEWFRYYWKNVGINMVEPNYFMRAELPYGQAAISFYHEGMKRWGGWTIFGLVLISLVLLVRKRLWLPFVLLGLIYAYFTLMMGFSYWQGSRLHYPAEIAASILIAYLVELVWTRLVRRKA